MLLQRLAEYAARDAAPPFHRQRRFDWQLNIDHAGQPESTTLQRLTDPDAKRQIGAPHLVPSSVRTVGVAANLAADDAQYVLGWSDDSTKPARVARCHESFTELTKRWAQSPAGEHDPVAQAVWAFLRDGHAKRINRPDDCAAKSGVLVTVAGEPAYRAPSVIAFWGDEVRRRKGSAGAAGLCLVCGEVRTLLDTVPGNVPKNLIPGATNNAALVSINQPVFGYDLRTQLASTPGPAVRLR